MGAGLEIRNVKSERQRKGTINILVVRGVIANLTDDIRPVPLIRITLYDASGEEVLSNVVKPRKKELPPGDEFGFRANLEETPATARRLEVTFTMPPEMPMEGEKAGMSEKSTAAKNPNPQKKNNAAPRVMDR